MIGRGIPVLTLALVEGIKTTKNIIKMDLKHYNHVFEYKNRFEGVKIAPKRSSFKQTLIDFALGVVYWGTFIATGLLITC